MYLTFILHNSQLIIHPLLMPVLPILFHDSQKPVRLHEELVAGLRFGELNQKFLYDSVGQAAKWLALHQACSPSRSDPDCEETYRTALRSAADALGEGPCHLIGLGCGGGKKDAQLLRFLAVSGREVFYTAVDVSAALVLAAADEAASVIPQSHCQRLVCDLAQARDLPAILSELESEHTTKRQPVSRLLTFFGMLPNFRPAEASRILKSLVRQGDTLLISANLAPGQEYRAGVRTVLPQYDNEHCKGWLASFLSYIGLPTDAGQLRVGIEADGDLERIVARYDFVVNCAVGVGSETVEFRAGSSLRLFYSYRHTVPTVRKLLEEHGFKLRNEWITAAGEEGVFAAIP
jgi:uncharacterized SAM-dependent methyltransferase